MPPAMAPMKHDGLGWGTSDPATRHPVTERSEVEVPRSDIVPMGKVPVGAALGDGRRPAVGCPAGKNLSWEII